MSTVTSAIHSTGISAERPHSELLPVSLHQTLPLKKKDKAETILLWDHTSCETLSAFWPTSDLLVPTLCRNVLVVLLWWSWSPTKPNYMREKLKMFSCKIRAPAGDGNSSPSLPSSVSVISWKRLQTCDKLSQLEVRWVSKLCIWVTIQRSQWQASH